MPPKLLELSPDRSLLDSHFNGYKLCLEQISVQTEKLTSKVYMVKPSNNQYSFLHAKLFGFHNHLTGETWENDGSVYFIDEPQQIHKAYVDSLSNNTLTMIKVWQVPEKQSRNDDNDDFNCTIKFASESLALVSDGTGMLYVLDTGSRPNNDHWQCVFCDEVIGLDKQFIIQDVVHDNSSLHCLLYTIEQESSTKKHHSVLYWVTLMQAADKSWGATVLRTLKTKNDLHYAYIERNTCNAIYCVSENGCKFSLDSENPIKLEETNESEIHKEYEWFQTYTDVTLKFELPENCVTEELNVNVQANEINLNYPGCVLLMGKLYQRIHTDATAWNVTNNTLEVTLLKEELGLMWPEVVEGDRKGKYIMDAGLVEEANVRLQHLCSDFEVRAVQCEQGLTFSSQHIEECDFEDDNLIIFERLCCNSHQATHRANLGSHHILLTASLSENVPPAMAIRYDVDACLWQPQGTGDNFCLKHEATLLAFGYVQASKQQKKFCACAPDLSYSVICEYNRHMFIYRQNKPINDAELRNRTTGRRFGTIAQQQVVNIADEEVLGVYASNKFLFLLTKSSITAYQL